MKNAFICLVQKCICVDFLINASIHSNSYQYPNLLSTIKKENLRNIKLICYLYEYIFKDCLILDDINSIKFDKIYENNSNTLLQLNLNILSDLKILKKYKLDLYSLNVIQGLIYSYFNFVSSIQYFLPIISNTSSTYNKAINMKSVSMSKDYNNIRFFNLSNNNLLNTYSEGASIDYIREISINAITIFFNYSLINNKIIDEYYEVFFENNPNNKFYQYFFKTSDKIFKVRILDNTRKIIYMYQNHQNNIKISPTLNKEDSKKLVDTYLQEKFGDEFENLFYDKNYINTYTYNNVIEGYKFKYNYKDNSGKINFNIGFYITINTLSLMVQEISLF